MAEQNSTIATSFNLQGVLIQTTYIVIGFSAFAMNCLVLMAVLLRKTKGEHFFYFAGALAFGDVMHGLGYFLAGARRMALILSNGDKISLTMWQCAMMYPTIFFTFGRQASIITTLAISIDRFIGLIFTNVYLQLGRSYMIRSIAFAYICITLSVFIIFYTSFAEGREVLVSVMCYVDYPPIPTDYESFSIITMGFLSCFLMTTALMTVRLRSSSNSLEIQQVQLKRQSKLTTVIVFIVFSTLLLWIIPNLIAYIYSTNGSPLFTMLSPYMWAMTAFSSTMNAIIFLVKNPELRKVLIDIITRSNVVSVTGTGA